MIHESIEREGVLMIPSFAVGRTQTLLYVLRGLEEEGSIPILPIYADSPMALDALAVYEKRIKDQNLASRTLRIKGKDTFRPKNLHLCDTPEQSKAIRDVGSPAIIIASSGMVSGGRILHHLAQRLPDPEDTVLFVGYQAEGTRGRDMIQGREGVKIHGRHITIGAKIENLTGLSGHADYHETLAWLMGLNRPPERVFIVHGEPQASEALATRIQEHFGWDVVIPAPEDEYELDL